MRPLMVLLAFAAGWTSEASAQIRDPVSSCKVDVDEINFGEYSVVSQAPVTSSGRVGLRCGGNLVSADARVILSTGASGRFQERTLLHGSDRLIYNLYVDPARRVVAGDGTQGTSTLLPSVPYQLLKQFRGGLRATSEAIFKFYGKIEPNQVVGAGEYTDTIQVIVEF